MMLTRTAFVIIFTALFLLSSAFNLSADNSQQEINGKVDSEHAEYVNKLNTLDKTIPNSILQAKDYMFTMFRNAADERKNAAFRSFWNFYRQTIRECDSGFSSNTDYQNALSEIANVTGLYSDPFPAFEKLDNDAARKTKNQHSKALTELSLYRKSGINFGSSEGMWYLKDDLDFLFAASSITTGEYKEYIAFYSNEWRKVIADDGALMISWNELRKRIVRWEQFANQHSQLPETDKDILPNISWMVDVYLAGIDNSRIYKSDNILDDEVKNSYESFLNNNTSSVYYNTISDVYLIWKNNQFRSSQELVNYLNKKGHGKFTNLLEQSLRSPEDKKDSNTAFPMPTQSGQSFASEAIIILGTTLLVGLYVQHRRSKKKLPRHDDAPKKSN